MTIMVPSGLSFWRRAENFLVRVIEAWMAAQDCRRNRRQLAGLDATALKDIGYRRD